MFKKLAMSLLAFLLVLAAPVMALANTIAGDLANNVNSTVFIYLASGVALTGTLDSVDASGVTVLSPSGGGTTEVDTTAIKAFTVSPQPKDALRIYNGSGSYTLPLVNQTYIGW